MVSRSGPVPFEVRVDAGRFGDLRDRLARTSLPPVDDRGWEAGASMAELRRLLGHWGSGYDPSGLEYRCNRFRQVRWNGVHCLWEQAGGMPVCLIHGWPGAPIEFHGVVGPLLEAGYDVVCPSLPGYAWSDPLPGLPNVARVAAVLHRLMTEGLGYGRYAVQGGDWGAAIAARMAWDQPESVTALHLNMVMALPTPGSMDDLSEEERAFAARALRWRTGEGHHLAVHSQAPDALAVGLSDSPAGLAAWLVEKLRRWSDCGGDLGRRFGPDDVCDLLTVYWDTRTIGSSLRLYAGEARDRWRLAPGERIPVPAAVADFPGEMLRPPRSWAERILDLRRWTQMPAGGHFAAWEEPDLLAEDVAAFLGGLDS